MRNESDLAGVKSVAKMLLMTKVTKTDFSPMVVQHPFTNSGIVGLPKDGGRGIEILWTLRQEERTLPDGRP